MSSISENFKKLIEYHQNVDNNITNLNLRVNLVNETITANHTKVINWLKEASKIKPQDNGNDDNTLVISPVVDKDTTS